jgi:hypothetical protein
MGGPLCQELGSTIIIFNLLYGENLSRCRIIFSSGGRVKVSQFPLFVWVGGRVGGAVGFGARLVRFGIVRYPIVGRVDGW